MPPFLAQGLCSGFRDANNLAWKLDLVLRGLTSPDFLDTYMAERGPNARATIIESMRVGQHVNERDPEKVKRRDAELAALQAAKAAAKSGTTPQLIAFRVPGFSAGFIGRPLGGLTRGAGDAFVQGKVRRNGTEGLFDDVAGRGFMIVGRNGDPEAALIAEDRALWQRLGGQFVSLDAAGAGAPNAIVDLEKCYARLMDEYACDVIVKRPDHYIFAACPSAADLPAIMADLREQLAAGAQSKH
jgi:hypothetical protein